MGIVNIVVSGGIGNQLFQFSYGVFISKQLGYDVCCFIGINLNNARDYPQTLLHLKELTMK